MTGDIWILKLLILLTLSSSKLIVILLNLSKSRLTLIVFLTDFGQVSYFTESGQDLSLPRFSHLCKKIIMIQEVLRDWENIFLNDYFFDNIAKSHI